MRGGSFLRWMGQAGKGAQGMGPCPLGPCPRLRFGSGPGGIGIVGIVGMGIGCAGAHPGVRSKASRKSVVLLSPKSKADCREIGLPSTVATRALTSSATSGSCMLSCNFWRITPCTRSF